MFIANWNGLGFHRFTPWYDKINQWISRMIESGLVPYWKLRYGSVQSMTAPDFMEPTFYRTWREMREEFNLNGGKQVEASGKATIQPLTMEDCAGIFGLWLVILLSGIVG